MEKHILKSYFLCFFQVDKQLTLATESYLEGDDAITVDSESKEVILVLP